MDKQNGNKGLLDEFSVPTYEEWLTLVNEQLKGAPFEKKLVSQTVEGFAVQPIYLKKDGEAPSAWLTPPGQYPYIRGTNPSGKTGSGWAISQPLRYPTPDDYNKIAVKDLARGLKSIELALDRPGKSGLDPDESTSGEVGLDGISIIDLSDLETALKGIDLSVVPLKLEGGLSGLSLMLMLLARCNSGNIKPEALKGHLVFDPLSELAMRGELSSPLSSYYDQLAALCEIRKQYLPGFRTISIDARPYGEGGGSATQELGYAMATAVEYFRELLNRGLAVDDIAGSISFNFAMGPDFFLEIAKLRSARVLWARIVELFGGGEAVRKANLLSSSSRYNKTVYDPYVNMLRATTEAFSAVIGGSDVLSVSPFDELFGLPDEMSRRTARNLQIILEEECHGNRVIDPAGGSWFVENLTDQLAEASWKIFQEVEKAGGMAAALKAGTVAEAVAAVDRQRREKLGQRRDVAVGTNMYANLGEKLPESRQPDYATLWKDRSEPARIAREKNTASDDLQKLSGDVTSEAIVCGISAAEKGATLGQLHRAFTKAAAKGEKATPLTIRRKTESYEVLRDKSSKLLEKTGSAPTVFLANMGPLRQHKARADFSVGFFQPGGFDVIYTDGFETASEAAAAAVDSAAPITVICSTDDTYPELVPDFVAQVKQKKPDMVVIVAGYPKEHANRFRELGVDEFIHVKADNLDILTKLQAKAGA